MATHSETTRAYEAFDEEPRSPANFVLAMRELKRRPPAMFGLLILTMILVMAIIPGSIAPLDPVEQDLMRFMKPPGYVDEAGQTYWLGTDEQGRDILSRIIWGSRISMFVGVATVIFSGIVGISIGIIAGYFGGWVDTILSRISEFTV